MFRHTPSRRRWRQAAFGHFLMLCAMVASLSAQAAVPVVTSIDPSSGPTFGGQSVTIHGSGFAGATSVTIGGAVCDTGGTPQSSDGFIICITGPRVASGLLSVDVTTPAGTNAANTLYTYADVAPTVTSIDPISGPTFGGQAVTIRGTGFVGATSVTIGGATCDTGGSAQSSDNFIFCITGARAAGGPLSVEVTTPAGTNAANTLYTYADVAPTVSAIHPNFGPTDGGQLVGIVGTGFVGATSVTIGGVACTRGGWAQSSDGYLECITGAHAAGGPLSVEVTTPAGTNAANALYSYRAASSSVQPIPTLSEWGLMVLTALISLAMLRRRRS